ncbi:MAG TPA: acetylxylan esterase [Opitutus sp.]|nr:acetylxylan esterase [Opitutus sp.]
MKRWSLLLGLPAAAWGAGNWVPKELPPLPAEGPALCSRDYLTPEEGAAVLAEAAAHFDRAEKWQDYAQRMRAQIQAGAGLAPWPRRTPLHPAIGERRTHDGYSVENVRLETAPGVFACGNLYLPLGDAGRRPAVLTTHGHTGPARNAEEWARHGRFGEAVQQRAATLARMGAVVLTLDMFGYGDSLVQFGADAHRRPLAMTVQLWNALRAVDFLSERADVDPTRIAVTGESGGGTQAFLLSALDERVKVSVPVVMASSYFFGGCPCESGRPIHRSAEVFASNAMIAALAAPRPMLLISDGGDWTKFTPEVEFPFSQRIYELFGAQSQVENVHLANEGHDYGPSKRAAMYRFLAAKLGLDDSATARDERRTTLESPDTMRVFKADAALPAGALREPAAVAAAIAALQR